MRLHLRLLASSSLAGLLLLVGCDHSIESPEITADLPGVSGQPGPVDPDLVCLEQLTTALTISGDGFTPFPTQTLQDTAQLLLPKVELTRTKAIDGTAATGTLAVPDDVNAPADSHVRWMSEQKMGFDVYPGLGLQPGLYDLKVTNRDDLHSADFPGAFAAVPRPAIAKVAPDILCDAQADQTVTLTGAGFLDVHQAVVTQTPQGAIHARLRADPDQPGHPTARKGPFGPRENHEHLALQVRTDGTVGSGNVHKISA